MRRTWPTEAVFYEENPVRTASAELDFGSWWLEAEDPHGPRWRISFVAATGELIAVCLSGGCEYVGQVELLGLLPPTDRAVLGEVLHGWGLVCGQLNGLAWIRRRLRATGRTPA